MQNNLLLAMLPTMHPSKSYIHLPVDSKEQAIAVVKAYGITKFDDVYVTEFHPTVKEGNPYQVHICHSEFLDLLMDNGKFAPSILQRQEEYEPTQEEMDAALADAETMSYNMRTYGTIDVPKENRIVLKDLRNSSKALRELAPTIIDENPPKFSVSATPLPDADLKVYTLWYTDECHTDCEDEFEAPDDVMAMRIADIKCKGNEGLWTGVSLTSSDDKELDYKPFG